MNQSQWTTEMDHKKVCITKTENFMKAGGGTIKLMVKWQKDKNVTATLVVTVKTGNKLSIHPLENVLYKQWYT